MTFPNLWTTQGKLRRREYALIGLSCFAVKFAIDHTVARFVFHRPWSIQNYLTPIISSFHLQGISPADLHFIVTMVGIALPFIWIGLACSIRRLRDAGLPLPLVLAFLVPALNLFLVATLCLLPTGVAEPDRVPGTLDEQEAQFGLDGSRPKLRWRDFAKASLIAGALGFVLTIVSATQFANGYGLGMFLALPFFVGFAGVVIYTRSGNVRFSHGVLLAVSSAIISGAGILVFGLDGVICLLMAAPIDLALAIAGAGAAYAFYKVGQSRRSAAATFSILLLAVPGVMAGESVLHGAPPIFAVKSSVVVNAPPEEVWKQVIAFSEIPAPKEWVFRAGVAYPIRAEMIGQGVGAERHCLFSTGAFVEPIQVWDEPRLLKFSVTSNPAPMNELSIYPHIDPPHLHGYLESKAGQFRLEALPGGKTLLEGTTWYKHGLEPAQYWRIWSDMMIHKIHMRVLEHIKTETEREAQAG